MTDQELAAELLAALKVRQCSLNALKAQHVRRPKGVTPAEWSRRVRLTLEHLIQTHQVEWIGNSEFRLVIR